MEHHHMFELNGSESWINNIYYFLYSALGALYQGVYIQWVWVNFSKYHLVQAETHGQKGQKMPGIPLQSPSFGVAQTNADDQIYPTSELLFLLIRYAWGQLRVGRIIPLGMDTMQWEFRTQRCGGLWKWLLCSIWRPELKPRSYTELVAKGRKSHCPI